jgi:hypothetical protein
MRSCYLFLVCILLVSCSNSKREPIKIVQDTISHSQVAKPAITKNMNETEFVKRLTELGYFDFTEKSKLEAVQASLEARLKSNEAFFTEYNNSPPYQFYDARFYSCGDGEELYEEGGAIALIDEMRPLLIKLGVPFNYSNDTYTNNVHTITVNGRNYILSEGSPLMWGEAIQKFAQMLNTELEKHNSTERIYLLSNENEYMVFLTQEQYQHIAAHFPPDKRPLTVSDWTTKTINDLNNMMNR